jgi:hypothetical protein
MNLNMHWIILIILILILIFHFGWWAVAIILAIILAFVILCLATSEAGKAKTENQPNIRSVSHKNKNSKFTNNHQSFRSLKDVPSVIDITPRKRPDKSDTANVETTKVPYWPHQYVYAYSEIHQATIEQKDFYVFFKNSFLNGEYINLNGNTNYAFILMFDLLREFEKHKDIFKLENYLKLLGQHYPKTKSYANSFLIKRMENTGNNEVAERIREEEYAYWKLGDRHREKLNLSREEVKHLNDLYYTSTKFNQIDFCMSEIVKLYCLVINATKNSCAKEGTTFEAEITSLAILISRKRYRSEHNYAQITKELCTFIFKHCEHAVRKYYGCETKWTITLTYTDENKIAYETKVISEIMEQIPVFIQNATPLNDDMEMRLYNTFPTRLKKGIKQLQKNYEKDSKSFYDKIIRLCELSDINLRESILHTATTFMLKHDNETSIKLYLYYLSCVAENYVIVTAKRLYVLIVDQNWDHATKILKNNYPVLSQIYKLNIEITNTLLKDENQLNAFKNILAKFIFDKNLNNALESIPNIFRKKIHVDSKTIEKIQQQHTESVMILNEYLKDEFDDENDMVATRANDTGTLPFKSVEASPIETEDILFSQIQAETLSLFKTNNFSIRQYNMETFAKSKGVLKNYLVESINELCYERLDDVLIEEDEDCYNINPDYYQTILAK